MIGLQIGCLLLFALASRSNAVAIPGDTFELSIPSNDPVDILSESGTPTFAGGINLQNGTKSTLGLPLHPSVARDYNCLCKFGLPPRFNGGQLLYSLLSVLSDIWKSPTDPLLSEPIQVRNVPFYNIQIIVAPAGASRALTQSTVAIFLHRYTQRFLWHSVNPWPTTTKCELVTGASKRLIGTMEVNLLPPSVSSTSIGSNIPSSSSRSGMAGNGTMGTVPTSLRSDNLRANGIIIHQHYTGTMSTDKNILYLFVQALTELWKYTLQKNITDIFPPGVIHEIQSRDRTISLRIRAFSQAAAPSSPFTVGEFSEGLLCFLLVIAMANRWESWVGSMDKNGQMVVGVVITSLLASKGVGTGEVSTA